MRARLASPRRRSTARGRLVLTAVAASVALVGGVVVAAPDSPVSRDNVQEVAVTVPTGQVGTSFSFDVKPVAAQYGATITSITGLPDGVTYDAATGMITGTPTTAGRYDVKVTGQIGPISQTMSLQVTVNNADGTPPAGGAQGGASGEAQVSTGSSGLDAVAGAVLGALGMGAASSGQAGTSPTSGAPAPEGSLGQLTGGSNGGATVTATAGATPVTPGPLGSLGDMAGQAGIDLGSLGGGTATTTVPTTPGTTAPGTTAPSTSTAPTTPDVPGSSTPATTTPAAPAPGPLGSLGQLTGNGQLNTDSLTGLGLPLASLGQGGSNGTVTPTAPTTTPTSGTVQAGSTGDLLAGSTNDQGQIELPGSSTDTGSLANLAPALGSVGLGLVGLAGLSLLLSGGSSTPGSAMGLPVLPGSSTTGSGGSAGAPATTAPTQPAPGPTVANGRG